MIILKSFGYSIVGLLTFIFLFFFFLIYDKLKKIVKKNKYADKTVAIAINLFFIVILLFGFCLIDMRFVDPSDYKKGVVKYSNIYRRRRNKKIQAWR